MTVTAGLKHHKELNEELKAAFAKAKSVTLKDVNGQRYIGCGVRGDYKIDIYGTPGNDLAAYMDGLTINVNGNVQDAAGNTMNNGTIIIHGRAGDALGYAMRNGAIYVETDVGYRCGIHMKEYKDAKPAIVIGGCAGAFLGEYMAGGTLVLLGLNRKNDDSLVGSYFGTGMHGGVIYVRGNVPEHRLAKEVTSFECSGEDMEQIARYVKNYCTYFGVSYDEVMSEKFLRISPRSKRPYGDMYAHI